MCPQVTRNDGHIVGVCYYIPLNFVHFLAEGFGVAVEHSTSVTQGVTKTEKTSCSMVTIY